MDKHTLILSNIDFSDGDIEGQAFEVLKVGTKSYRGGTLKITQAMINDMAKNFKNDVVGTQLALDMNHDPEHRAYAWISDVFVKGDALMMKFKDFTDEGSRFITDKVFKYFSVEFQTKFDKVINGSKAVFKNVLRGVALTNRPVDKDIAPTFLSEDINLNNNLSPMDKFSEYLSELEKKDSITSREKKVLDRMAKALSEEELTSLEERVNALSEEAAEETTEAPAEEATTEEAATEETTEEVVEEAATEEEEEEEKKEECTKECEKEGECTEEEATEEEADKELAETVSLSEYKKLEEQVRSSQSAFDKLQSKVIFSECEKVCSKYTLSEESPIGLSAEGTTKLSKFAATLSEEQRTVLFSVLDKFKSVDLSEYGHGEKPKTVSVEANAAAKVEARIAKRGFKK